MALEESKDLKLVAEKMGRTYVSVRRKANQMQKSSDERFKWERCQWKKTTECAKL